MVQHALACSLSSPTSAVDESEHDVIMLQGQALKALEMMTEAWPGEVSITHHSRCICVTKASACDLV